MNFSKFLSLSFFIVTINACNNVSEEDNTFKTLNESLTASISATENINNKYLYSLASKLHDVVTQEKAAIWNPKALKAKEQTDAFCDLLNTLKSTLKAGTNIKQINERGSFENIFSNVILLKDSLGSIDKDLSSLFVKLPITTVEFDISSGKDFYTYFFQNKSNESAIATLNAFENNARILEQHVLWFCDLKCQVFIETYDQFQAIVAQSTSYIKAGESIEINAGVGSFTKVTQPKITVNGKLIELNYDGVATKTIKGSSKPGKHYVPVSIEFIKPDGQKTKVEKEIEYTVAE